MNEFRSFLVSAAILPALAIGTSAANATEGSRFRDGFERSGALEETGSPGSSASTNWWLNSGARLHYGSGTARTIQGFLPSNDPWRAAYASSNPVDTDGGHRPQNLLRLVTRDRWRSFRQELSFRIERVNTSDSPERNGWNGVLLFHRYVDSDNLYYAGLRVDGAAVIKKKREGRYTTLAYRRLYPGTYDRATKPNLLPERHWIRLRTVVEDLPGGSVRIRLEVRDDLLGPGWFPALEAEDTGGGSSGPVIAESGHAGVRTDFMDLEFDDFDLVPPDGAGVFVASGDLDGDGAPEIVTGPDRGTLPLVRSFRSDATSLGSDFLAYGRAFRGGVRVAACDVTGDGRSEIVTAPGPGGGPHVRVFDVSGGTPREVAGWFAYGATFTGGVFVGCADVTGDGKGEVITGADAGGGPHVRVFRVASVGASLHSEFLAYDPGFRGGVRVAACDVDGDGRAEIVTGAGPGGGPHVRVIDVTAQPRQIAALFAYAPSFRSGISVACADLDGDARGDIVTGAGAGGGPHVRVFGIGIGGVTSLASLFAFETEFTGGVWTGATNFTPDSAARILAGAGAGSRVRSFTAMGEATSPGFLPY